MGFHIVIPARYRSQRLPGKPLLDLAGKPIIQHVYERACEAGAQSVTIATDDQRIADVARRLGAACCMTSADHASGTDRAAEVVALRKWADDQIVVNVQGDEPLIPPAIIRQVARLLWEAPRVSMATLCEPMKDVSEAADPNVVKVVFSRDRRALYFSRAPIPWSPGEETKKTGGQYYRHIGIYAYRAAYLKRFTQLSPAPLERTERLEQLRALWHGDPIAVAPAEVATPPGVDTPEDLQQLRHRFGMSGPL